VNHFTGGKCKGFQFFQPKNEYEIKLMMEGKINYDELSQSQRQFHDNSINNSINLDISDSSSETNNSFQQYLNRQNELYNSIKCQKRIYYIFFFVIFGNCYIILKAFNLLKNILAIMIYILLTFSLFFQMIFLNIFSLLLILIYEGFRDFILRFDNLHNLYAENLIVVFINILIGNFCFLITSWKDLINRTHISNISHIRFFIYFSCAIMSIIIYYPQRLLFNIVCIIIFYIYSKIRVSNFMRGLDRIISETFNKGIGYFFRI
jgi:hypothetical protein